MLVCLAEPQGLAAVYKRIHEIVVYEGVVDLLANLVSHKVPLLIVTSSPRPYCSKVVSAVKFPITDFVCYHDTANRKPHPDPMHKALEQLGLKCAEAIAVGDEVKDVQSATAAGIFNIACTWGSLDSSSLRSAGADLLCETVEELHAAFERLLEVKL